MQSKRHRKDYLFLVLKGLAMGAANKVPGVSGGLVAFVAGFYQEFIYSLQRFNKTALRLVLGGRFKSCFDYVNGRFLCYLVSGMIISYFSISKFLDFLLIYYEIQVWSLFFGMVIGSIWYIYNDLEEHSKFSLLLTIIGAGVGLWISFLDPATQNDNLWFVFFCGVISVSGMTLPGFSGSFILILLGNYVLLLVDAVNALYDTIYEVFSGNFSFYYNGNRIHMLKILAVFTLGSITGLVTFSHLLNYILTRFKQLTIASIFGFIIGSLGVIWPWKSKVFKVDIDGSLFLDSTGNPIIIMYKRYIPEIDFNFCISICSILLGILIVLGLDWYGKKSNYLNATK